MPKDHENSGVVSLPDPDQDTARPERRLLFLSHANPEDNAFAEWLATQLASAGYAVWCDVTQLLGGEKFWDDITEAIEQYAFRVLFASTIDSNRKPGTLKELRIALDTEEKQGLKDFIVPLKADQFPFASTQASISERNFVRFEENWAHGLSQLLKLLEREGAPKSPTAGPACVAEWYRRSIDDRRKVVVSDEKYFSNWFRLKLPNTLRFHRSAGTANQLASMAADFPHPYRLHGDCLVTFAPWHEVQEYFGPGVSVSETIEVNTARFIEDGDTDLEIAAFDARNIVSDLIRQAWEAEMIRRGLCSYGLASGLNAWFFKDGHLEKNRAYFTALGGRKAYRQLVGRKSRRDAEGRLVPDGNWHYALSVSPQLVPYPRLVLRHHVLFTDDGETPWASDKRMHKARRGVCRNWWNREWRDRLFAYCSELGKGAKEISLPAGDGESIRMATIPISFISPWTYFEDGETGLNERTEIELVEDTVEEEEEEEENEDEDKDAAA